MKFARAARITAIALLTLLAIPLRLAAQEQPRTPTFHGKNGRIAWKGFVFADFTTSAIFSAKQGGTDVKQLTFPDTGVQDDVPDWSPDGSTIMFTRNFPTNGQLYRINADGTGLTQISDCTRPCLENGEGTYSPDGTKIAFIKFIGPIRKDGSATDAGVWIMDADGTNPVQITQLRRPTKFEDRQPTWSPDGTQLVFHRISLKGKRWACRRCLL